MEMRSIEKNYRTILILDVGLLSVSHQMENMQ